MQKQKHNKTYLGKATKRIKTKRKWLALAIALTAGLSVICIADTLTAKSLEPSFYLTIEHKIKPVVEDIEVIDVSKGIIREVTAYNVGVEAQTDKSPCIGASGDDLCKLVEQGEKICAANFVPLKSKIYIDNFGECLVLDRMNSRFKNRVDIAMSDDELDRAIHFGVQNLLTVIK